MKLIVYIGIVFLALGCNPTDSTFKLPDNAKELISGKTSKAWKLSKRLNKGYRMNMDGCFLSYIVTYHADGTFSDNNGQHQGCGKSLVGTWDIVSKEKEHFLKLESPLISEIMGIDEDYKMMKILKLQDKEMQLQFVHKEFTESAKMIDFLVPVGVEVPDRRFQY